MAWELTAAESRAARSAGAPVVDRRLLHHLVLWLGRWPAASRLDVVGSSRRLDGGWDGEIQPARGVFAPEGGVLSVPPDRVDAVRGLLAHNGNAPSLDEALLRLPEVTGFADRVVYRAVFRWSTEPAPLPDLGVWRPADDPILPDWLRPFGEALVALDERTGEYLAGVGVKRHDAYGREIAVGTAEAARGRGLARALVAQAARRIIDEGAIPTYLHDPANTASAKVADAAGFADRGWFAVALGRG